MNRVVRTAELMALVSQSHILGPEALSRAQTLAAETPSGALLARRLVACGLVTTWQAGRLLRGYSQFRLGNYILKAQIARGDSGQVFLAEHPQLRREVAIKALSRRLTQYSEVVAQFLADARDVAALDHRNILHVFDVDSQDGRYFLVMERVRGCDLQQHVEQHGPVAVDQAVGLLRQTLAGLAHAHAHGVLHRDLQPSNLMLDEAGVVKITGFGAGRLAGPPAASQGRAGEANAAGDSPYLAPEQQSAERTCDVRSDLFALGATVYYLLTGQTPPRGQPGAGPPPWPDVPEALRHLVWRMMDPDPARRFDSAEGVEWALQAIVPLPARSGPHALEAAPKVAAVPAEASLATASGEDGAARDTEQLTATADEQSITRSAPLWLRRNGVIAAVVVLACASVLSAWLFRQAAAVTDRPTDPARVALRPRVVPRRQAGRVLPELPTEVSSAEPSNTSAPDPGAGSNQTPDAPAPDPDPAVPPAPSPVKEATAAESATGGAAAEPGDTASTPPPSPPADPAATPAPAPAASEPPPAPPPASPASPGPPEPPAEPSAPAQPPLDLPAAVDLPALESTAAAARTPCELGRLVVPDGASLAISLLGGQMAAPPGTIFQLDPVSAADAPQWRFVCARTSGSDAAPVAVAELTHMDQRLMFTWLDAAARQESAAWLRNCALRIHCGIHTHDLRLRRAERADPIQVNLKKSTVTLRVKLPTPPDPAGLRLQVAPLGAPWPAPCALDPAEAVPVVNGQVRINLGDEIESDILTLTAASQFRAVLQLTCDAAFRPQAGVEPIPYTAKKLQEAELRVNQNQTAVNAMAQRIRAAVTALSASDPLRPGLEAELKQAEQQLAECTKMTQRMQWLDQTRDLVANGAPIHFRVFYLADGCAVDLVCSDPSAFP